MTLSFLRNGQEKFYKRASIFFFHEMGLIAPQSKRYDTKTPQFKITKPQ